MPFVVVAAGAVVAAAALAVAVVVVARAAAPDEVGEEEVAAAAAAAAAAETGDGASSSLAGLASSCCGCALLKNCWNHFQPYVFHGSSQTFGTRPAGVPRSQSDTQGNPNSAANGQQFVLINRQTTRRTVFVAIAKVLILRDRVIAAEDSRKQAGWIQFATLKAGSSRESYLEQTKTASTMSTV